MAGQHAAPCREPGSLTATQRQAITGWVIALSCSPSAREAIIAGMQCPSGCIDDLSEQQAGDLLEILWGKSRPDRRKAS